MSGKKNKQKWILLLILFLVVAIGATTIIYMDRIREFLPNDDGAISLTEDAESTASANDENTSTEGTDDSNRETSTTTTQQQTPVYDPDFVVSDDEQVWGKKTEVEIFRVSYANGEQEVTVQSDNEEKVVAPGTEQSYTFKLKNAGNVALDYEVDMELFSDLSEADIPLECRVHRYDGTWITGGNEEWVNISELSNVLDQKTLGSGRYTTYTLDWRWPFEVGKDEYDTSLGNLAVEQDIVFTVVINTRAEISGNPEATDGIIPRTGDNSNAVLYVLLMTGSIALILILLWFREKEEEKAYE